MVEAGVTDQEERISSQPPIYDPARHFALRAAVWDETEARVAIGEIVADALERFEEECFWPVHPMDGGADTGIYFGAAGVIWALDYLQREGAVDLGRDYHRLLPRLLSRNRSDYARMPYPAHASLLFGDVGVLLLMMRIAPSAATADELFARIAANLELPVLELMWGTAGSMLACVFMAEMTGEERWRAAYQVQARRLLKELKETQEGPLWTQQLYGERARYLGPVHGYAGNMLALIRGWDWLEAAQQARISRAVVATLKANARRSGQRANWPAVATRQAEARLVQHCHGAAGMVTALADLPTRSPELHGLLRAGGELTWHAGPLVKGSNLCHGTGGNGYAFLKLHRRLGESVWLVRARAFAMAAIAQCRGARNAYGRGRYSLWTGDAGLAVYLWDCIRAQPRFPTTEVF
jgi:Lanthionine synthetase C-like protein